MGLVVPYNVCIRQWFSFRLPDYPIDKLMHVIIIWDAQLGVHQHGYRARSEIIDVNTLEKIFSLI